MDELIRQLTETYGPSGFEETIRSVLRDLVAPLTDEVRTTPLGSLVAVRRGSGNGRRIMLAAHMDEIGVMVTYIDEKGFLRFTPIGGVSPLTCLGARVRFENGTLGVIGLEKREDPSKAPTFEQLYIDGGATGRDDCPVRVGDAAVFERPFAIQGRRRIAKAMDDRIGCAVLVETLRRLGPTPHEVHFVFSVQEETTLSGARTAAYGIEPDMAIAVDVTGTGDTPESRPMAVELGKGPAIKVQDAGMIAHPAVREWLVRAAEAAGVPYQMEVLERGTTDAAAMQLVRSGVPSGCLSIPCRYVYTPSEMVDREDVEGAVRLLQHARGGGEGVGGRDGLLSGGGGGLRPPPLFSPLAKPRNCATLFPLAISLKEPIMPDPRAERFAAVLVQYSTSVQPGDLVAIQGSPEAAPLLLAVYEEVLRAGGHPHLLVGLPGAEEAFFRLASDAQLEFVSPLNRLVIEQFDAIISVRSDRNTRELSGIDPARQRRRSQAMAPLLKTYLQRGATGELKWVATQYPTAAYAQEADMSLRDYEDFVYDACFCNGNDAVARWREVHERQQRLVEWLKGKREVRITGPNADLTLSIEGRVFINCDGRNNMPDGEIFTGPVEDSARGWVRFTYPAVTGGREVEGVELWFEDGRVVRATARKNEEYLLQMLEADPGARYLGEFAFGTNSGIQRFTKNILFDEKIGGSFHLALGAGYPETGSRNESAIHWDMICDMRDGGEVWVDGELFYRDGEFVV